MTSTVEFRGVVHQNLYLVAEFAQVVDNLLKRLDEIYDPDTGTCRLHRMSAQEKMSLDIESTKTTLLGRDQRLASARIQRAQWCY
ncbi:MAG TPA: hypothetical protein VF788_12090 [Pseudonocardiaceae bacterium]|jgi:hypothetical protein